MGRAQKDFALLRLHVERVDVEQLPHVVPVVDMELPHCLSDAVIKGLGTILDHLGSSFPLLAFQCLDILALDNFLQSLGDSK